SREAPFPGAHLLNCFFASPIFADGKLIVAGGAIEQVVAAFPGYRGCDGRGFVMALEPKTGRILWKYDVGPKPERLDPPITIKDSWGAHVFPTDHQRAPSGAQRRATRNRARHSLAPIPT